MVVDMHVHTMVSSLCSVIDPDELVRYALESGLDALCVTEHETLEGARVVKEIGRRHGFRVFEGYEAVAREGHVLVFGCGEEIRGVVPAERIVE
ncbi:MAG: PHP domain-containing protein, partial [bacterium]